MVGGHAITGADAFRAVRWPEAGNHHAATGTCAAGGDFVFMDQVAAAHDQGFAAAGAARVFPFAHPAGRIAGIDEVQPGFGPNFHRAQQVVGFRRAGRSFCNPDERR